MRQKHITLSAEILLAVTVILFLLIGSYSTSFLFENPSLGDSAIFQIIGKGWSEGLVPYIDLWDSKGPIIFFINRLGYDFTGNSIGILIIQFFCLYTSVILMFKLLTIKFPIGQSVVILLLVLINFSSLGLGGNTVAEYLLPLLCIAYYRLYLWTQNIENCEYNSHPNQNAFLYGIIVAFSLFSRLTNCIGIITATFFIAIWLIKKNNYKNLFENFICFVTGFFIISLPCCLYFWSKDALQEMWYGTFIYNLDYTKNSSHETFTLIGLLKSIFLWSETWILALVSIILLLKSQKRRLANSLWFIISFISLLWFCRSNGYAHYEIISLPLICIAFLELKTYTNNKKESFGIIARSCIFSIYTIIVIAYAAHSTKLYHNLYSKNEKLYTYQDFLRDVPKDYKDSFIAYNPSPDLYLYLNITPKYPLFVLQDFGANTNIKYAQKIEQTFGSGQAKWILTEGTHIYINNILKQKYELYKEDKQANLYLFRLK